MSSREVSRLARAAALLLCSVAFSSARASDIIVRDDPFLPYLEHSTGQHKAKSGMNSVGSELMARTDRKTGALITLVHVDFAYTAEFRRTYESARNIRAEALAFTPLASTSTCIKNSDCVIGEAFTLAIPLSDLRQAPASGYAIKVFARRGGDTVLTIPKGAIDRLLAAAGGTPPAATRAD